MITIVGSGIIGLSTAWRLLEAGYRVRVYTKDALGETTSNKAAAIWLPYLAKPVDKVNRWSRTSYAEYVELSRAPGSGISLVELRVLVREEEVWWKEAVPEGSLRPLLAEELPAEAPAGGYSIVSPLIETQIYLHYLAERVRKAGAEIVRREVTDLAGLLDGSDWVINCSGRGARELVGDRSLYAIKGQLLKVDRRADIVPTIADFAFDEAGEQLAYVIPRQDYLILGGTAIRGDEDLSPNAALATEILERCRFLTEHALPASTDGLIDVGLRPGRPAIRVEREGRLIHNYGHGGAGYTVCWGCAEEVVRYVEGA